MKKMEFEEVGAVKSITQAQILQAVHLVKKGKLYDLDCGRWNKMPVADAHPPFQVLSYRTPQGIQNQKDQQQWLGQNTVNMAWNSEMIMGTVHSGTHIDALNHITCGHDNHWYGGVPSATHTGDFGTLLSDASKIPPIVTKGVLLDVAKALGFDVLPKGYKITPDDIHKALRLQNVNISHGDAVLIRTGYMSVWPDRELMAQHYGSGIDLETARLLADAGAVVIGGDNESLEVIPSPDPENPHPVHIELLVNRGVYIMEMVFQEQLARDQAYEFLFVCLPLNISGATGSMVRPIAMV